MASALKRNNGNILLTQDNKTINLNNLIDAANRTTGDNDATLNNALQSLIDPYEDINDAINAKGVSGTFLPSEMAAAITAIPSGGGAPFLAGSFTHTSGSSHTIDVPRLCSNVIVMLKSGVPTYNNVFAFLHYANSTASQHGMYARQGSSNVTYAAGDVAMFAESTIVIGSTTYNMCPGDYYWIAW